jgi:hypothetical protein
MSDTPDPVAGGRSPTRRCFFAIVGKAAAVGAATTSLAGAALAASSDDAAVLTLRNEIIRLRDRADEIIETQARPYDDEWHNLLDEKGWDAACEFGSRCGRENAIEESNNLLERADELFKQMLLIPAQTQAGRAAKVTALLYHVMPNMEGSPFWRGPSKDLDWDVEMCRSLLAQFAGMSEEELPDV